MEVVYELNQEDLIAFYFYHQKTDPKIARGERWALLACGLFTLQSGFIWLNGLLTGKVTVFTYLCGVATLFFGFILLFCLFRHRIAVAAIKKKVREGQADKVLATQRLLITPEGITSTTPFGETTTRWVTIEKIGVTDHHAFFYYTPTFAYALPTRAFHNEQEFLHFVETAERYWRRANNV